jgi:hypothetical protein
MIQFPARLFFTALLCSSLIHPVLADTLHSIGNGLFWHHESGWIFPERIGDFVRIGMPQDVAGSSDVVAHYARTTGNQRITAVIDVYGADSAINAATFTDAKKMMDAELGSSAHEARAETPIKVGAAPLYEGSKAIYEITRDGAPAYRALYFIDTGDWNVKVQITAPANSPDAAALADEFVRAQRWDRLGKMAPNPGSDD